MQTESGSAAEPLPFSLPVFLLVAFGFSWGLWFLVMASSAGLVSFHVGLNPFGSLGPAVGAIAAALAGGGKSGLQRLFRPMKLWRVGAAWYLFAAFATAGFALVALVVYLVAGNPMPSFQNLDQWYMIFPLALVILVIGGPLGEEIGWRGALLPVLQEKMNSLYASLVVGGVWFLWHLPLFWLEGSSQYGVPIPPFLLWVIVESILFTWLYNRTGGSLLLAVLYHNGINVTYFCLPLVLPALDTSHLFNYSMMGASVLFALIVLAVAGKKLEKKVSS